MRKCFQTTTTHYTFLANHSHNHNWTRSPYTCYLDSAAHTTPPIRNCGKLNFAKAHFQIGGTSGTGLKQAGAGSYAFVDTRNNNFSNRSQKMQIEVAPGVPAAAGMSAAQIAGLVFGIGIPVLCVVILALAALGAVLAVVLTGSTGAVVAFIKRGGKSEANAELGESLSGTPKKPKKKSVAPAKPRSAGGPPPKPRGGKAPPPKPTKH